jgi:hypothetical protein
MFFFTLLEIQFRLKTIATISGSCACCQSLNPRPARRGQWRRRPNSPDLFATRGSRLNYWPSCPAGLPGSRPSWWLAFLRPGWKILNAVSSQPLRMMSHDSRPRCWKAGSSGILDFWLTSQLAANLTVARHWGLHFTFFLKNRPLPFTLLKVAEIPLPVVMSESLRLSEFSA